MKRQSLTLPGERIACDSHSCPHTAAWLTDSGMLYCQGHQYLGKTGTVLPTGVKRSESPAACRALACKEPGKFAPNGVTYCTKHYREYLGANK